MVFEPVTADGAPAGIGASGRWLSAEDLFAADAKDQAALSSLCSADWLPLIFPRDWPAVFTRETLKVMVNKTLRGVRCRAVVPPSAAEVAAAARLGLRPLHSFDNAEAVAATLGWPVVKGFLVLERVDAGADGASFVAIRHWWNVRESGTREGGGREGGVWLDLTPRPWGELGAVGDGGGGGHGDARVVLVESLRGEKLAAPLSAAGRDFATALAARGLIRQALVVSREYVRTPAFLGGRARRRPVVRERKRRIALRGHNHDARDLDQRSTVQRHRGHAFSPKRPHGGYRGFP